MAQNTQMFSNYSNRGSSRFTDCDAIDKEKGVAMSDPHIVLITELSPAYIIESAQNGGE